MSPDQVILIAAGRGKRLGAHTDEVPKCMVEVAGKPMFGWVWKALSSVGAKRLVVVRGYRGDVLEAFIRTIVPDAIFVDNDEWQTNNVLLSLAKAHAYLDR
ncbi:MAG TPA: NTP transferase domain-containing protein, partial [Kofleriaceae bacterium]